MIYALCLLTALTASLTWHGMDWPAYDARAYLCAVDEAVRVQQAVHAGRPHGKRP